MPNAPRHTGDDYAHALMALLPRGNAWPRDADSNLARLVSGMAEIFGDPFDKIAAYLLDQESDPRFTRDLLERWETAFGLPDACVDEPLTIADRISALLGRMMEPGGQSIPFFYGVASALGYSIEIHEFSPFMAGISEAEIRASADISGGKWGRPRSGSTGRLSC